jgi:uncharacterized membrane protein YsdA (DUF1294 family)
MDLACRKPQEQALPVRTPAQSCYDLIFQSPIQEMPMPEHAVLPLYLAAASLIDFLIMLLDLRRDREGKDPLPPAVWIAASAAGGAPGVLLAFAVMRTHIMKATVGRFFCGLCFTIIWGVMLLAATGLIDLTLQSLCQAAARSHTPLVVYLLAVNLAAFSLFAADKRQARRDGTRIPEAVLLGTGLLGGAPGGMLAMQLFRHKTKKASFVWGMPLTLAASLTLLAALLGQGIV